MQGRRTNGLITLHRHGTAHYSAMAERSRSAFCYGDSDAAKRQRMRDIRAKRTFIAQHGLERGTELWQQMVERHRQSFAGPTSVKGESRT